MSVEAAGRSIPIYNVSAVLHLRNRVLFFYFYGNIEVEGDLDVFTAEATKMVEAILAANRVGQSRPTRVK